MIGWHLERRLQPKPEIHSGITDTLELCLAHPTKMFHPIHSPWGRNEDKIIRRSTFRNLLVENPCLGLDPWLQRNLQVPIHSHILPRVGYDWRKEQDSTNSMTGMVELDWVPQRRWRWWRSLARSRLVPVVSWFRRCFGRLDDPSSFAGTEQGGQSESKELPWRIKMNRRKTEAATETSKYWRNLSCCQLYHFGIQHSVCNRRNMTGAQICQTI